MQFIWSLFQLLVFRISCIEAVTADVEYIPTWADGTFKSCNGAKLVVDGGVSLTCTYTLTDVGEAVQGLEWYEHSANTVGTQVYASDGVSAGAVQGGTSLDGRAVGSFDGTTNTLTITGFTSTDIASYNCRVITSTDQADEVVTITTPVVDSDVVDTDSLSDIAFTGYDDGEIIETTGEIELEIILQNIEDDNQDVTYPCSPIEVSGPSDSCTISSTSTTSKCTITISESEYEDGALTVEAHGKMGSSSAGRVVNGRSIEVTISTPPTTRVASTVLSTTVDEGGTTTADPSVLTTESPTPSITTEDISAENDSENDKNEVIIAISVAAGLIVVSMVAAAIFIGIRHGGGGSKPVARKPRGTSGTNFHYRSSRSANDVTSRPDYVTPGSAYAHSYAYAQPPVDYVMARSPDGQMYRTQNLGQNNYGYRVQPEYEYAYETPRGAYEVPMQGYNAQRGTLKYGYGKPATAFYG